MSATLVTAQMLLIAALALPIGGIEPTLRAAIGGMLVLDAVALAVAALLAMRLHTFSVLPEPKPGASLCRRGPYAWIRHPMYSAVLLGGIGAVVIWPVGWKLACLALLGGVLAAKIHREESLLLSHYPDYAAYRRDTRAIIPGLL